MAWNCAVCGAEIPPSPRDRWYSDVTCPGCGTVYEREEGIRRVTAESLRRLGELAGLRTKKPSPEQSGEG